MKPLDTCEYLIFPLLGRVAAALYSTQNPLSLVHLYLSDASATLKQA